MKLMTWLRAKAGRGQAAGADSQSRSADSEMPHTSLMPDSALMPDALEDEPGVHAEVGGLDFVAAIRAHQAWKGRLLAVVEGRATETLDATLVARDDQCVLGCWLHGAGARAFAAEPLLPVVMASHARFHQLAGQVLQAAQQGRTEVARQMLATDYHRASVRVQGKLAEMFLQVGGNGVSTGASQIRQAARRADGSRS